MNETRKDLSNGDFDKFYGSFHTGDKPPNKFMALYNDGSGGKLFYTIDGSESMTDENQFIDDCGDTFDYDYFVEAGYCLWVKIPDSYSLWQERILYDD
jgi:hypothetical protein